MNQSNLQKDSEINQNGSKYIPLKRIRETSQKPDYRIKGNILARKWARPTAVYGTWLAVRLGISAHTITTFAAITWVLESFFISTGDRTWFSVGVLFGFAGFWLDHVDGQIARVTKSQTIEGIFFDFWIHSAHALGRAFGLGWGLYQTTGYDLAILFGMATGFGWLMLSYSNDSKYKALFAHLNASQLTYIIKKRDAIRKNEATTTVLNFRTIVRWTLLKAQEPHVVLLLELLICFVMWANPTSGVYCWLFAMIFWAITAPLLAVARLMRYVHSSLITNDFHEWFKQASDV
jgi:hypothetical protein